MSKSKIDKIPEYVLDELSGYTIKQLLVDKHNLSYPIESCCQARIVRNGITHGQTFNYREHGGIENAVRTAIAWVQATRKQLYDEGNVVRSHQGKMNVSFIKRSTTRADRDCDEPFEYYHTVHYIDGVTGKPTQKLFWHGYKNPTPGQWLHGQHTALLFRHMVYYEEYPKKIQVNREFFKGWKHKRLYLIDHPYVDYNEL